MKKLIVICAALCFLELAGFAQNMDSALAHHLASKSLGTHYLQKSRTQSTVGWIMVGGGITAMMGAGINTKMRMGGAQIDRSWALIGTAGFLSTLTGMAFFQSAKVNQARARILLRGESITPGAPHVFTKMTAVGISIHLGALH